EDDLFALPADLAARPLTADYKAGPAAKVKSILTDRCARCHQPGAEKEQIRLDVYEEILRQLGPAAGPRADAEPPKADGAAAANARPLPRPQPGEHVGEIDLALAEHQVVVDAPPHVLDVDVPQDVLPVGEDLAHRQLAVAHQVADIDGEAERGVVHPGVESGKPLHRVDE